MVLVAFATNIARGEAPHGGSRPTAWYRFAGSVENSLGDGLKGEIVGGGLTWTRGTSRRGALFNGSSYVRISSFPNLQTSNAVTVSLWARGRASGLRLLAGIDGFRGPSFQVCGDTIYLATNDDERSNGDPAKPPWDWTDINHIWSGTANINLTKWTYVQQTLSPLGGVEPKLQVVGSRVFYEYFGQDSRGAYQIWTAESGLRGEAWTSTPRTHESQGYRVEQDENIQVADGRVFVGFPKRDTQGVWQLWTGSYSTNGDGWTARQRTFTKDGYGFIPSLQVAAGRVYYLYAQGSLDDQKRPQPRYGLYVASERVDGTDWRVLRKLGEGEWLATTGVGAFQIHNEIMYLAFPAMAGNSGQMRLFTGTMSLDGTSLKITQRTDTGDAGLPRGSLQVVGNHVYYVFGILPTPDAGTKGRDMSEDSWGRLGLQYWTATSGLDGGNWNAQMRATGLGDVGYSYKGLQVVGAKEYVSTMRLRTGGELQEVLGVGGANLVSKGDAFGIGVTEEGYARAFINAGQDYRFRGEAPRDTAGETAEAKISSDRWHQLVMTYNGANLFLYVDGKQAAKREYSSRMPSNPLPLLIGDGFQGALRDVVLYPYALDASEVAASFREQMPPKPGDAPCAPCAKM